MTANVGYTSVGYSKTEGSYEFTLTEDSTFYPVVGPIFETAYTYNQTTGEANYCVTGEEETCEKTTCYQGDSGCNAGTIFKYAVKSTYDNHRVDSLNDHIYYFHVLHDDGDKLTLQQRESPIRFSWSGDGVDISEGPITAIENIKNLTNSWGYVENQSIAYGTTEYFGSAFTGCVNGNPVRCNTNLYTWNTPVIAKARLVTAQEIGHVGCQMGDGCPVWAYNYLKGCINKGCTVNGKLESAYWLSNALDATNAFRIYMNGHVVYGPKKETMVGILPVIELSKTRLEKRE